ncbi:MAG: P-loop NTPase [Myxococcaceae bacterium]
MIELARVPLGQKEESAKTAVSLPPGLIKKRRGRRIIAVGGGKGGIGKTLVSANLGIALAQRGNRVILIDVDLGGANLHTCLGVPHPTVTLSDYIHKKGVTLEQLRVPSGVENLSLIAGANDVLDAANPKYQAKQKLVKGVQGLEVDYVILDLGAGTSFHTLDFWLVADHGILVLMPEPTSIENAYRFVKAAFFRRLQNAQEQFGIPEQITSALSTKEGAIKTPHEFVARVKSMNPVIGAQVEGALKAFRARLIVNQARTAADQAVGTAVCAAWKKFFGLEMDYLGAIGYDDEAWRAVRKKRPILLEQPGSTAARALLSVADSLMALESGQARTT